MNPLNENGIAQAKAAIPKLATLPIKVIYCSDLERARQTAQIVNEKLGLEIIYDERLREFGNGQMGGTLRADLPADYSDNPKKYGAETAQDVFVLVKNFFDELKAKKIDNALIVSHGASMGVAIYMLENPKLKAKDIPVTRPSGLKIVQLDNAQIFEIDIYKEAK